MLTSVSFVLVMVFLSNIVLQATADDDDVSLMDPSQSASDVESLRRVSWGPWSPCSRRCNQVRLANRTLDRSSGRLKEHRKCHRPGCHARSLRRGNLREDVTEYVADWDVIYQEWSPWSPCTRSCRMRRVRTCTVRSQCEGDVLVEEKRCRVPGSSRCRKASRKPTEMKNTTITAGDELVTESEPLRRTSTGIVSTDDPRKDTLSSTTQSPTDVEAGHRWQAGDCGVRGDETSLRIVGGQEARPGAWPWQVAILTRWKEQYCGAVLISPYWALTAAHCLRRNGRKRRVILLAGDHDLSQAEGTEIRLRIERDVVHEHYDIDTIDNDIALVQLKVPVYPSDVISYACIPREDELLPPETLCYVVGWGKMRETHLFGADVLRQAKVPLVPQGRCQEAFEFNVTDSQMCAGFEHGGMDACAGDSGGPLMCEVQRPDSEGGGTRWVVYGVTSFGEGCGDQGKYGIYTRVTNYGRWIDSVTGGQVLPSRNATVLS